jgi:hypothetical protein
MQVGVDQGYEPQSSLFSQKLVIMKLNIVTSARVSKHSGIPSLNVCMNCQNIAEVAESTATPEYSKAFYDEQIQI